LSTSANTIECDTRIDADSSNQVSSTDAQDRINAVQNVLQAIGALEGWQDHLPDLLFQAESKHNSIHSLEFAAPKNPPEVTMFDSNTNQTRTERPQTVTLNRYDLGGQFAKLRADAPVRTHGRDSFTLVKDPGMDVVLTVLNTGTHLSKHTSPGPISVLVLEGRIAFTAHGQRLELGPHCLVTLPTHVPHEVEALEESAILITIASPVAHTDVTGLAGEREVRP
jgi:quercetin dioxygenase-like cupin family protein